MKAVTILVMGFQKKISEKKSAPVNLTCREEGLQVPVNFGSIWWIGCGVRMEGQELAGSVNKVHKRGCRENQTGKGQVRSASEKEGAATWKSAKEVGQVRLE